MKRLVGFIAIAFLGSGALLLGGCSGRDASSIPQASADATLVSASRAPASQDANLAAEALPSDVSSVSLAAANPAAVAVEAALNGVDPTVDAAPADVAGMYVGTIQDRSLYFVEKGKIQLVLHQNGSTVSGFMKLESGRSKIEYTFTGTASATTKGVLLKLSLANSQDRTDGFWVKIIGTTLFGKGWADPDPAYDEVYEQLLFTLHKT